MIQQWGPTITSPPDANPEIFNTEPVSTSHAQLGWRRFPRMTQLLIIPSKQKMEF
jgi:hypothetical protein